MRSFSLRGSTQIVLARSAWVVPVGLLLLSWNQVDVALDVRQTLRQGVPAVAEVLVYERIDRAEITYGYVDLRVQHADGSQFVRERMSLPQTLMHKLEGLEVLEVRVVPEADQDVVIVIIAETQWRIAAIQAAMAFVASIIALAGVIGWNRLLRRGPEPKSESAASASQPSDLHAATVSETNAS